jgi:ATPase subunit of ABC transporter with duplicated ATPase domains
MTQLVASNVSVTFGNQVILDQTSISVNDKSHLGIVAPNGVGKSTLLKVLVGELPPDTGTVSRSPASATVLLLAQEHSMRGDETLVAHLARRTGIAQAQAALDASLTALATEEQGADDVYDSALQNWLQLGAADFDQRAEKVIADLGLAELQLDRNSATLSGGQRARLSLAVAMLAQPDILLLDEPTNDLDDDGLSRLEDRLLNSRSGFALVSHDRVLLSSVTDQIYELDEFTKRGSVYSGGWDSYIAERELVRQRAITTYSVYETERARLLDTARTMRQWASAGAARAANPNQQSDNDKNRKAAMISGAQNTGARAAMAERAIARLDRDAPDEVREPWHLQLSIAESKQTGNIAVQLTDVRVRRGDVSLGPLNLTIGPRDRLRIVGPNGSGKTTLIDALLGRASFSSGRRYAGPRVVFGELDQSRRSFATQTPVVEVVSAATGMGTEEARTLLAKFRMRGDKAMRPSASLSPGERTRAALALLQGAGVNFLVLDEPTNHLDIEAIEQLEEALASYHNTLVLVTHDRRFAEAVPTTQVLDITTLRDQSGR